jgi:hypothetical protein
MSDILRQFPTVLKTIELLTGMGNGVADISSVAAPSNIEPLCNWWP